MLNPETDARRDMYIEKKKEKRNIFQKKNKKTRKNSENENMKNMKKCEKKKEDLKGYRSETAQKIDFVKRNVVRTREAIETKKNNDFSTSKETKSKEKT